MAFEKTKIRTVSNPTIILIDMDQEQKMLDLKNSDGYKSDKFLGKLFPYILINNTRFLQEEIGNLEIDCTNFLPIIHLKLIITRKSFISKNIPKDGDIVSVYIRSHNDTYKPIRNDYLITRVETENLNDESTFTIFTISGILNIKKIWIEKNKAFKGTSLDVIKKVATELELGFATNIDDVTNDEMTWICDWKSYKDFILHIANHAWKNENTFYRVFIDIFYNVNYIEVEKQLDQTKEFDEALIIFERDIIDDFNPAMPVDEQPNSPAPLILSNFESTSNSNNRIIDYNLINNSSAISYSQGYGKRMYFYDHTLQTIGEENLITFNPLATPGTEDTKIRLRGLKDETIEKEHLRNNWYGIQYSLPSGNVHQNFALAQYQNYVNNKELEKMYLDIDLWSWNPAVIKMERIPILITVLNNFNDNKNFMSEKEIKDNEENFLSPITNLTISVDRFLSGFYLIEGFKLYYDLKLGRTIAKYRCTRREWGVPQSEESF
jgi:hypothetical protein